MSRGADGRWQDRAACLGRPTDDFYVREPHASRVVDRLCVRCPVRQECAEAGVDEPYGVWGGLTEGQRRRQGRP